jgi:hypothetical protein
MDWEQLQLWHNYLINTEHKDVLLQKSISDFNKVITDHKNKFSNFDQNKEDLTKKDWDTFGKINVILNKIKIKYKINLELPRKSCKNSQKYKKEIDVKTGMMYNIPAELNGIDTNDNMYIYVPLHKTRRHIHGIPYDFIEQYLYNMINTAIWDKVYYHHYYNSDYIRNKDLINSCAIYECPEKYCIKNLEKNKNIKEIDVKCKVKINVFSKINELKNYLNDSQFKKLIKYFNKKLVDNFRINFPKKSKHITWCTGSCIYSDGLIHQGIPNGKQNCYDCNITFCRECNKSPYHDNELCNFSDEIIFENPQDYRKCPGCGIWIEKSEGCSHMICGCSVHFCYDCRGVLCANDPYFHICKAPQSDPHYRDFRMDHPSVKYVGEVACNCSSCVGI